MYIYIAGSHFFNREVFDSPPLLQWGGCINRLDGHRPPPAFFAFTLLGGAGRSPRPPPLSLRSPS